MSILMSTLWSKIWEPFHDGCRGSLYFGWFYVTILSRNSRNATGKNSVAGCILFPSPADRAIHVEKATTKDWPEKLPTSNFSSVLFLLFPFGIWSRIGFWIQEVLFQVCMNLEGMNQMEMVDRCDIERKWLSAKDLVQGFTSHSQMATGHEHLRYRKAVWGIDKSITISTRMRIQSPQSDSSWKTQFQNSAITRYFYAFLGIFSIKRSGNSVWLYDLLITLCGLSLEKYCENC